MTEFHVIEVKVPLPSGSRAAQNKVIASYEKEMEALRAKLPEGAEMTDKNSSPRGAQPGTKRKTTQEKIDEAVAADRKNREGFAAMIETQRGDTPNRHDSVTGGQSSVTGGVQAGERTVIGHAETKPVHPAAQASRSAA